MSSQDFIRKKSAAEPFEKACYWLLKRAGRRVYINKGVRYEEKKTHDIADYTEGHYLYDCKMDFSAASTGRYCIEKDSLDHTQSDGFLIGRPVVIYVPVWGLKQVYEETKFKKNVGEWNGSSALVPIQELESKPFVKKLTRN